MNSAYKIQKITREDYDTFTRSNVCSVFQKIAWLDSTAYSKKYSRLYLGGYKEGKLIGVCGYVIRGFYPFYIVGSPMKGLYTEIGGPVFLGDTKKQDIETFVYEFNRFIMRKYRPIFYQFTPDVFSSYYASMVMDIEDNMQLQKRICHSALITPSESVEICWHRLEGRARTAIRKAKTNNIVVRYTDSREEDTLLTFYDLYKATFDRRGLKPRHSYAFFESILNGFDSNLIKFAVALYEQEVVSAAIFIQDRNRLIYLAGVSTSNGLKLSAQSLVLWNCIEYCTQKKLIFDLGGLGDSGIDKFKESFGGEVYQKFNYIYVNKIVAFIVRKLFKITL